jgi:transcriptional regulator with XRE-family HTH domain
MPVQIGSASRRPPHLYLKEWRNHRTLTQSQLGDRVGKTKGAISRWENGERVPDQQALADLAFAMDCDIVDFYRLPSQRSADALLRGVPDAVREQAIQLIEVLLKTGTR